MAISMTVTICRKYFRNAIEKKLQELKEITKKQTTKNVQRPGSLLGRFKAESKEYRPDILR